MPGISEDRNSKSSGKMSMSLKKRDFGDASVVLASYNGEVFVGAQLDSILHQSSKVSEILVSDDGSSDSTLEIVAEIKSEVDTRVSKQTPRITVIQKNRLGVAKNFETALQATTGSLIFLSDQDDVWIPQKVEKMLAKFRLTPELLLVFSDGILIDSEGRHLGSTIFEGIHLSKSERRHLRNGEFFRVLMRRNIVTGATVALNRELVTLAGSVPNAWLHDEWFAVIAAANNRIDYIDEQLIQYRLHDSNQVGVPGKSMKTKMSRLRQSHADRSMKLYLRAKQLHEFIQHAEGIPEKYRIMALKKYQFEDARRMYPSSRFARLPKIAMQLLSGNYFLYGTGLKDALRNLLQPA